MPASTFTLAVGRWHQVPAEIPSVLQGGSEEQDKPAKPEVKPAQWTECGLGSSTSEAVKDSPPQTGRYCVIFPLVSYFLLLKTVDPFLSLQCSRHLNFSRLTLIAQVWVEELDGIGYERWVTLCC